MTNLDSTPRDVGTHIREWRQRRRMTQLDLALEAEISARHLSFVETGKAQPSRDMVLNLCDRLDVPLRERNAVLLAAGFAPVFPQRPLGDPAVKHARAAIDLILKGHEPFPALAIDRHWTMVSANRALAPLLEGAAPHLIEPPVNVLRLSLHPEGLATRIVNLPEWRAHIFERLRHQIGVTGDEKLSALLEELKAYPAGISRTPPTADRYGGFVVPLQLQTPAGLLSFFSATTVLGTPVDVTLSELAIESFFPADDATAEAMRAMAGADALTS